MSVNVSHISPVGPETVALLSIGRTSYTIMLPILSIINPHMVLNRCRGAEFLRHEIRC